jgi:hypothetical protein
VSVTNNLNLLFQLLDIDEVIAWIRMQHLEGYCGEGMNLRQEKTQLSLGRLLLAAYGESLLMRALADRVKAARKNP